MTVQFRRIEGFNQLQTEHAQNIIYGELLPACENAGVILYNHGNLVSPELYQKYRPLKEYRELFNVARVQQAYQIIVALEANNSMPGFCSLKEKVEEQLEGITTGDLVVAFLLRGHIANFHSPKTVTCDIIWTRPLP